MSVEYTSVSKLSRRFEVAARIAPERTSKFMAELAEEMVDEMRKSVPVKKGELRGSIRYTQPSQHKIVVGSFGAQHAKFVTEGTGPSERVSSSGKEFIHPGQDPNPAMIEARDKVLNSMRARLAGITMEDFRDAGS